MSILRIARYYGLYSSRSRDKARKDGSLDKFGWGARPEEEMLDDNIDRKDIEHAILKGRIAKKLTHDLRGTRYRIEGTARDGRIINVL